MHGSIGVGHRRVGFAGKWGTVGENPPEWCYQEILKGGCSEGIYLSPQQMISLSQNKPFPKHNPEKSDVFAFGVILIELVFR